MSTGLQPDHGSDHMLPTRDRASRRRQGRGRLRGAPDVGREADWADRGSTLWGLKNGDARLGWQTVPGRVQLGTKEGCHGSDGGGVWYRGPQPLYLHDGASHSEGLCASSDVVVEWLEPVLIVDETSSRIGDDFEARTVESGAGWLKSVSL
jgi:hypothetical protein